MTTHSRATLLLSGLKKTILEIAPAYRRRGNNYYDAPPIDEKTPLVQDLEEMMASPLTRGEERDVLIETLVIVRVLEGLRGEEWGERLRGVFEGGEGGR